jgi:serine/threonine protein kinase
MNIKIADFGFANYYDRVNPLKTFCGSAPYAAPEVYRGQAYYGPEIDCWSLGVILYVLVTGSLPFNSENLQHLRQRVLSGRYTMPANVSIQCQDIISKIIVVNVDARYNLDQIKQHEWFKLHGICDFESKANSVEVNKKPIPADSSTIDKKTHNSSNEADRLNDTSANLNRNPSLDDNNDKNPVDTAILRIMNSFGLNVQSTINVRIMNK